MRLRIHPVPVSETIVDGSSVHPSIRLLTRLYRSELDKHYAKDIAAVRVNLEEITCQRLLISEGQYHE